MTRTPKLAGAIAVTLSVATAMIVVATRGSNAIPPSTIDPADFSDPQANPYFPLVPGTVSRYRGVEDGERFRERLVVTERTKTILGVETVVIVDVLKDEGVLAEKTDDWYQADDAGNVWYFGEETAEYNRKGEVISTSGSWEAGVDGARAGIIMPANPRPSDAYFQEFYRHEAEDQGWVVNRREEVRVPYGRVTNVIRTYEWSRLEPHVVVIKQYGPDLGIVRERIVAGGSERLELVAITTR
jgi:hypothetical protein